MAIYSLVSDIIPSSEGSMFLQKIGIALQYPDNYNLNYSMLFLVNTHHFIQANARCDLKINQNNLFTVSFKMTMLSLILYYVS
jgi:hypothetical protein